ncbi:MAG: hypothetical protein MZV63_22230 [Marinilabiliales bacterium]|nr:hypothetical protein [Marinilabiliales bacterium]
MITESTPLGTPSGSTPRTRSRASDSSSERGRIPGFPTPSSAPPRKPSIPFVVVRLT